MPEIGIGSFISQQRRLFFLLVGVVAILIGSRQQAEAVEKPNIVFIMVDDLGKEWIGCYGADNIETPHIDALAEGGMKFHNCYSMPQCTPTRATLLTGQYPWRTGWTNHWDVPRWGVGYFDWQKYTTFATLMKSAGYATAIAGKWQINDFRLEPEALKKHGFDDWCVWTGYEAGNPASAERYWDAYVHTREGSKTYQGKFGPDLYTDFLIDFAKQHRDEPLMLYFPMALTHGPLVHTPHQPQASSKADKHTAMVEYTDHLVGRLVQAFEELGLRERTIFVFTTDNGTSGSLRGTIAGQRPSGGKASNYEGGVCEPLIVNCPGTVPGGVETVALTDFSDLLPTFAELGGAKIPDGLTIDGHSIAPVITGKAKDSTRQWIMALGHGAGRLDEQGVRARDDYSDRVIRDKRYKIWIEPNRQVSRLFDLQTDPLEQKNLIDSQKPEHRAALAKLQAVAKSQPQTDARPQYRPRKANSWDKQRQSNEATKPKGKRRKKDAGK
ncbi:MAG TPA: N-acetylgalactosamine 6-sulfate sulfatase [Planctomycetaceae bacterium]|nr:N-acetylgalactosamine 6-sulfate sulfatase [Blastopirellula sp.]HAY81949.1 N-acetylgalactosamine 6-sulfate sulfatase [Planctomycetaceae bacterium]